MRETMLLHDGVELPCIMETIYEIHEQGGAVNGSDDLFIFTNDDPAVLVEYALTLPEGMEPAYYSGNGAPEPKIIDTTDGTTAYVWRMVNVGRRGVPPIDDPAVHEPYATWSTWSDWSTLGAKLVSRFDNAAVLDDAIADTLAEYIEHEPTLAAKARRIADFVGEYTRGINYNSRFWQFSPRSATRTFETAYGHSLDRAILAAALCREVGLRAEPVMISRGLDGIDHDIPGLSRFREITVFVGDGGLHAIYDPAAGTLRDGLRSLDGRIAWKPKHEDEPSRMPVVAGFEAESRLELILTLEPGSEGNWNGRGYLHADGALYPYDEMTGLEGQAAAFINKIIRSVLAGADAGDYSFERFVRTMVIAGFDFTYKPGKPDDHGRTNIIIGDPTGGIIDALPADVHLYDEQRTSPVVRFGTHRQRITVRIKTTGREIVHLPEERELENGAGRFELKITRDGDWVTVERFLRLGSQTIQPAEWPHLRALLLEETDSANRLILLK
jgi:hypothetical protein